MGIAEAAKMAGDILEHIGMHEPSDALKEWAEEAFHKIAGEDKEIDAKEMTGVLTQMLPGGKNWCHGPSVEEVGEFFDTNEDDKISEAEFLHGMGEIAD